MNDYLRKKIQFQVIDYRAQIVKNRLNGMPISLILINKDNLTKAEFKEYILEIIDNLDDFYKVTRMPVLCEYSYILKVSEKEKLIRKKIDPKNINPMNYY